MAGDDRRMTIVDHLEELRRVLIISGIAWVVCTIVAFVFHAAMFDFLLRPLTTVLTKTNNHITSTAVFTTPTEGLTIPIKISMIAGIVGALPFLGNGAVYLPDINSYLSFLLLLIMAFGVTFELPVAIILLGMLGIVSSRLLRRKRKGIWVAIIAAALIVTPGADPYTPTALFIPLIIFFEASILILDKVLKR